MLHGFIKKKIYLFQSSKIQYLRTYLSNKTVVFTYTVPIGLTLCIPEMSYAKSVFLSYGFSETSSFEKSERKCQELMIDKCENIFRK